jgi:hypothetical protein
LTRLSRTGRAALRMAQESSAQGSWSSLSMRALARCAATHSNKGILFSLAPERVAAPMPLRQECLKARQGGLGGQVAWRKLLKAPGGGCLFFQTAKNPVAEAKPGLMGLCNQSAFNLKSVLRGKPWLPLPRVAVARSVSQTLPFGMFILRAIFAEVNPGYLAVRICSQVSSVIFRRIWGLDNRINTRSLVQFKFFRSVDNHRN